MAEYKTIDAKTAAAWLEKGEALLVDVRNPEEFAAQHIAGSVNLPLGRCGEVCANLPQGKKIIVHCLFGKRGASACEAMCAKRDDLKLYNLEGGLAAWQAAGLEVQGPKGMPLQRQVQVMLGLLLVGFTFMGLLVNHWWYLPSGFIGLGLLNAGLTGWCGMAKVLQKMPWNRR